MEKVLGNFNLFCHRNLYVLWLKLMSYCNSNYIFFYEIYCKEMVERFIVNCEKETVGNSRGAMANCIAVDF